MLLKIRYKTEAQKNDEDIEVAYMSLYPNPQDEELRKRGSLITEVIAYQPVCYLELMKPENGSLIRHISLAEVDNIWVRDPASENPVC